ncbi:hypothetical protein NL529_28145, partial [Klebsiella pneumoniae]|nr:hypothetical protein [Klebsiella pneumoniae]
QSYALVSAIFTSVIAVLLIAVGIFLVFDTTGVPQQDINSRKTAGWFLIILGIIILIIAWVLVILTQKSKTAAEIYGSLATVDLTQDILAHR